MVPEGPTDTPWVIPAPAKTPTGTLKETEADIEGLWPKRFVGSTAPIFYTCS